ncbi:hypothetical protein QR98_0104690 [Sarcoptes scabiei]|nr:hypothetical protein QR98_0104690 [Sarcoptes scabiei]
MFPCYWNDCGESFTSANALRKHLDLHVSELENQFTMTAVMLVREAAMRGNNNSNNNHQDIVGNDPYDDGGGGGPDLGPNLLVDNESDNGSLVDPSQLLDNHMSTKISNHQLVSNGSQLGGLSVINNGKKRTNDHSFSSKK